MPTARRKRPRLAAVPNPLRSVAWDEVLASITDAVILIADDDVVLSCNPATETLLRLPQAQIRGRDCQALFARSPGVAAILARTHASAQTQTQAEESLVSGDRTVPVRIITSPLFDRDGQAQGTVVVIHDLRYQRALQEDVDRAERLSQLGAVAAGLAHEIKNPLGGIKGAAQLLQREYAADATIQQYASIMIRETDRLTAMVEQLLHLGANRPPQFTALNIHKLIREVLLMTQEAPNAQGIAVRCEFDPSLPPIRGDERQLKQVLLNLLANSFDALQGRGTVRLLTRIETDFHIISARHGTAKFIRLEVADDGPGIPAEHLSRIFDPFFTTKSRGTGLGLAISHRIIAEHGGSMRAAQRAGGGTVISVNLPVATE